MATDPFIIVDGRRRYLSQHSHAVVIALAEGPIVPRCNSATLMHVMRLRLVRRTHPRHRTITLTQRGLRLMRNLMSKTERTAEEDI